MMTYLHLNSKFDAKIEFYKNNVKIFEAFSISCLSNEIDLEIEDIEDFDLKVFALSKENVSYTAKINNQNEKLVSNSKQIKIFNLPENHYYFVLFPLTIKNENFNYFDKVEIDGEKIKTLKLLKDIKKHAKVEIFEPFGDKLKISQEYFVALSKEKIKNVNPAVIFLEFFQDLKVADFKSAKSYFTTPLSERLSENVLSNFFEKFDDCVLINYYDDFAVLTLNYTSNLAKVFGANFENNLIANIYEIE